MNSRQLIYFSVSKYNILPLTSRCGVNCLFCSHRYNPPGVGAVFFGELGLDTVQDLLDLLNPKEKIVIGESATRLCEGEPFSHPKAAQIIALIRRRFVSTPIQITTNGTGLTGDMVRLLAKTKPLELIVSLNSADPEVRRTLMGTHPAEETLANIAALSEQGNPWHASLVLLPHLTGWEDVEKSLAFADAHGAKTVRLLLPGFSRLADVDWTALAEIPAQAKARLPGWRRLYPRMPITLEPSLPEDLRPIVAGVLADSPAAGVLRSGDEILSINDTLPFSRVDAFYTLHRLANPMLRVQREGAQHVLNLTKPRRSSSGLVMDWDVDPQDLDRARTMAGDAEKVLLLTSLWAQPLWQLALPEWQVLGVNSTFFAGNIAAAGLLTVADYRLALAGLDLAGYDKILLPPISFDQAGLDLRGEDCLNLAAEVDVPLAWS